MTTQLERFFSWRPDPEAEALDTFNRDWSVLQGRSYAMLRMLCVDLQVINATSPVDIVLCKSTKRPFTGTTASV